MTMMKKTYIEPKMDVIELKHRYYLMAGSPTGSQVYNEYADAEDDEYGL